MNLKRFLKDKINLTWMIVCFVIILILPLSIAFGLIFKSLPLFKEHNVINLLFSTEWRPLANEFGFLPYIMSSLIVTVLAIIIAGPICLFSAIHLTQYARKPFLNLMQPVIDILAGIPSVIYGVWGILVIIPLISKHIAPALGYTTSGYSILAGAIVLSVMIIPFILNILIEVIKNVPKGYIEASLSLGATKWETIKHVLLRKAAPGIVSALGLGISRAFGETIAVLMVVGNVAIMSKNVFDPGYPLPALIANNYGEMMSIPRYDSALMFAALILFIVVTFFNLASRYMINNFETRL